MQGKALFIGFFQLFDIVNKIGSEDGSAVDIIHLCAARFAVKSKSKSLLIFHVKFSKCSVWEKVLVVSGFTLEQ